MMHLKDSTNMNQRRAPKKRYSSYIPPTKDLTLEEHVTQLSTPTTESNPRGCDASSRVKSCKTPHFNALQNAVSKLARIDDFDLEDLGYGFFSDVFKVTHKLTGKVMVLKRNKDTNTKMNILREVQLMNRLSHPNILKYMGVCVHQGQLHALTEFINGGDLDQLIEDTNTPLSWPQRISLSVDIACGLKYLHSMGIFHRDMTAKNCLVKITENSQGVKSYQGIVADLGLAEKIPASLSVANKLSIVGTPYYMAPEVLCGKPYNDMADVFSFGIILCQLIARVSADPEKLPRSNDFGLERDLFYKLSLQMNDVPPPDDYLQLAYHCCEVEVSNRISIGNALTQLYQILHATSVQQHETVTDENGNAIRSNKMSPTKYKTLSPTRFQSPTSHARLNRSYSDITTDVITASTQSQEQNDLLQNAFMNPFSNLEYLDVGAQKIIDTPSDELLALTFDLPTPGGSVAPTSSIRTRFSETHGPRPRPTSLLMNETDSMFTQQGEFPSRQVKGTPKRKRTTNMLNPHENYAVYFHEMQGNQKAPPPSPLRESRLNPPDKGDMHNAIMHALLFSPHGRKYSSWWLSCQQNFINDSQSVLSPVLSIVAKQSHKIRRSVSLPNLQSSKSNDFIAKQKENPPCLCKRYENRLSDSVNDYSFQKPTQPCHCNIDCSCHNEHVTAAKHKARSKTIDDVFHEVTSLESLPEEIDTAQNVKIKIETPDGSSVKSPTPVSFSNEKAVHVEDNVSSCSSNGSSAGIMMALQSGMASFSKRKCASAYVSKSPTTRVERNSRDSGYNDDEMIASLENLSIS